MADFNAALTITLVHEGGFNQNKQTGEVVNMGITQRFLVLHHLPSSVEAIRAMTRAQAAEMYEIYFWTPLRLSAINDQTVAAKVFDLAVNVGPGTAGELLQGAANDEWGKNWLRVDGKIGSATIGVVNEADPVKLLAALRARAADHYHDVADKNPELKPDLPGWLARLAS